MSFTIDNKHGIIFHQKSWSQVLRQSKSEQKPIFIFASTPYCHLSRTMETLMEDKKLGEYYKEHFICIQLDPSVLMNNIRLYDWGGNHSARHAVYDL
jgi:thioredoxin-related protein